MDDFIDKYSIKIEQVDQPPKGGACMGKPLNIWFPYADKKDENSLSKTTFAERYRQARSDTDIAKQICRECSVLVGCLNYALHHESYGIWGGLTERERQTMRRIRNIKMVTKEPINVAVPGMNLR